VTSAPVEATIDCGASRHRLRWHDGVLEALDHPDAEGERLLLALGGDRPMCLDVVAAWEGHADDLRFLTLGPRHEGDRPGTDAAAVAAVHAGPFAHNLQRQRSSMAHMPPHVRQHFGSDDTLDTMHEHLQRHLELLRLFTLPPALQRALCAAVAAAWCERDPDHPALHAALVGRAGPALRAWAGEGRSVDVACRPRGAASVDVTPEGVTAVLPPTWLVEVWGPGLAVVDDEFVVAVTGSGKLRTVAR